MTRRSTCLLLALLLVPGWACESPAGPTAAEAPGSVSAEAQEMVTLTNAERNRSGLALFTASPRLMQAAQIHAEQMVAVGQMAHVLPGARYPEPEDRLAAVGYHWQAFAENVAYGQSNPAAAVSSWMNSSGHRANILNSTLIELGTGFARDASGRPYYVQVFGRPQ
jgi:uncharacterized protein YkwD